jgi:hypothetical protein
MSFDIVGKAPRNEAGECFRINNGGWHELKNLCFFAAPEICSQIDVVHWSTNDGYGLDDPGALALADALEASLDSGAANYRDALSGQRSAANREEFLRFLSSDKVVRHWLISKMPTGKPWLAERARKFVTFLRNCGGFELW